MVASGTEAATTTTVLTGTAEVLLVVMLAVLIGSDSAGTHHTVHSTQYTYSILFSCHAIDATKTIWKTIRNTDMANILV